MISQEYDQVSIRVDPLNGTAIYGDLHYSISCFITGSSAKFSFWSKSSINGDTTTSTKLLLGNKYTVFISFNGAVTLTITNIVEEDEQDYFCNANIGIGLTLQTPSRLIVNGGLSTVVISPSDADVLQGQSQFITCIVTGQPAATAIRWYFTPTGSVLQNTLSMGNTAKYSGGNTQTPSLTVLNFQLSDSGYYACSATNAVGTSISTNCSLRFISVLDITASLPKHSAIVGDSKVTLSCSINGTLPAIIWDWTKAKVGGGSVEIIAQGTNNAKRQIMTSATNPNLNIFSITENDEASIRTAPGEPEISRPPINSITTIEFLSCSSTGGNPPPSVIWFRNDIAISSGTNTSTSGNTTTTTLILKIFDEDDFEVYECQAANDFLQRPLVKTTYLTFNKLGYPPGQPIIAGSHLYDVGDIITLVCSTTGGTPKPTVNWLRDDNIITNGIIRSELGGVITTSLSFTAGLEDHLEVFECQADNGILKRPLSSTTYIELYYCLVILVAPKVPILTGPTNLISGSSGTWTCSSMNGYPAQTISIRIQEQYYTNDLIILQSYDVIDRSYTVTGTLDLVPSSDKNGQNLCCDVSHLFNNKVPQSVCIQLTINDKEEQSIIVYVVIGFVALLLLFVLIIAIVCYRNGSREQRNRDRVYYGLDPNQKEEMRVYNIPREDDDYNHYMTIPGDLHNTYFQPIS
ncbi:unnamed protein product [Mytilus edulis]|uniref:Ig-like domain-containing protein n=1 Tax=Mytilus edulis TaxID=6550 RepID=A0A8S3PQ58_MYTED|nr:unnamed protein product [Mytilus edulis]